MEEVAILGGMPNNMDGPFGRAIWNDRTEAFCAPWDLVGYNYLDYHYEEAGLLFPNRVICCTESKPRQMKKYWEDVQKYPYLIGDFVWTSMDYIGEAGIGQLLYVEQAQVAQASRAINYAQYPWRTAGCGDFDLCGNVRPQMAYRSIVWGSKQTRIFCLDPAHNGKVEILGRYAWPDHANSWTWPVDEGTPIQVEVYSGAPEVELLLNGTSLGRVTTHDYKAAFRVPYAKGSLTAIGYDANVEISRDELRSAGAPAALKITPDKTVLSADGQSLCYALVQIVDGQGMPVPYAEVEITASVDGAATLQAFGSARPKRKRTIPRASAQPTRAGCWP